MAKKRDNSDGFFWGKDPKPEESIKPEWVGGGNKKRVTPPKIEPLFNEEPYVKRPDLMKSRKPV